jgi:signal transduction histidine kinase
MRAIASLTSNAIKYTQQKRIIIALQRCGSRPIVEVHDTGPGLQGEDFVHALQRNQRLDRDSQTAEGSGLGLSVVKEIVVSNGWQVTSCDGRSTNASIRIWL